MNPYLARLALLGTLALSLACGDDGNDDDTAAGTTVAAGSTSAGAETTAATEAAGTGSSGGGDSTTGVPAECESLCGEGEICVVPGTCSADPPFCAPADMIICDFATGVCGLMDVCSGTLMDGALLCETCG